MFYFPQRKCSVLISTPGRSSTSELRSASRCRSRFFQYHLRRTPSALSHSPCTPCPLRRKTERVIREDENTVPGFDTVVWLILKESSDIISVWNLFCSASIGMFPVSPPGREHKCGAIRRERERMEAL